MRVGDVEIALHREHGDDLAARLLDRPEVDPWAGRRGQADLLGKFTLRGRPRVVTLRVLPFGYRPGTVVPAGPERASGVRDQNVDDAVAHPVQQQASAELGHRSQ